MNWLRQLYEAFKYSFNKSKQEQPSTKKDFSIIPTKSPVIFEAIGFAYGYTKIIHRVRCIKLRRFRSYPISARNRKIITKLSEQERTDKNKKHIAAFTGINNNAVNATHLLTIGYEIVRDGTIVFLFRMPLNFDVAAYDADTISRECCEFVISIISQDILKRERIILDNPNRFLYYPDNSTVIFWLALLFTRYRRFYNED